MHITSCPLIWPVGSRSDSFYIIPGTTSIREPDRQKASKRGRVIEEGKKAERDRLTEK